MTSYATPFGPAPFTYGEALASGMDRETLRLLLRSGEVRRVVRGVYVDVRVEDSLDLRAAAVAKVLSPGCVVCLRTAGWLWGVDVLAMGAHLEIPPIDLMTPSGAAAPRRTGCVGHTGVLLPEDVVVLNDVRVTTRPRTAADLGRYLPRPDALASYDAMLRAGVPPEEIAEVLSRFARARGVVQGRELLALADPRAESPMESRTRLRCVDAGFPCPEPQIEVWDDLGRFVARLDMGYRKKRKAVEFDGHETHSTAEAQRHDHVRREAAEQCGWGIAVVTGEHVLGRSLAFERAVAELLDLEPRLTRHHPRYGGWEPKIPTAA
jgi:hypothetical protein